MSICIPTWEQHGFGLKFLTKLLESIYTQTFNDYEIIISDHSKNNDIQNYVERLPKVRYFKYNENYGNGVCNTNNALIYAQGEIIKIMFQDDFLYSEHTLQKIESCFKNNNINWLVTACNHTTNEMDFYRPFYPSWNKNLVYGVNTISSPSVLSFLKKDTIKFDDKLVMLMDVDFYYQLFLKYGEPFYLQEILVTNRIHEFQISTQYDKDINDEISYIKMKYNI
jgi:glycosyltransferase involved in cell wall biosynthesis